MSNQGRIGGKKGGKRKAGGYREKTVELIEAMTDYLLCLFLILLLGGMPFYFSNGYTKIGTDKAMFFRNIWLNLGLFLLLPGMVLFSSYLLKKVRQIAGAGWKKEKPEGVVCFSLLYLAALTLSLGLSGNPQECFYGTAGWYMGYFTQTICVLMMLFLRKVWKPRTYFFYGILGVSGIVLLLGYFDRIGIYFLKMANRNESFISTVGNINWFCGYAVIVFSLGLGIWWKQEALKKWQDILLTFFVAIGFGALIMQGSESGTLALAIVVLILFWMSVPNAERMLRFLEMMLLFFGASMVSFLFRHLVENDLRRTDSFLLQFMTQSWFPFAFFLLFAVWFGIRLYQQKQKKYPEVFYRILAIVGTAASVAAVAGFVFLLVENTLYPGRIGALSESKWFVFNDTWGSNRGATWRAALMVWQEQDLRHKLFGVGPDGMAAALAASQNEQLHLMLKDTFQNLRLTNAHNEWLTIFVNVGALGVIGFVGIMFSCMQLFFRKGKENGILCGCGLSVVAYTVNNMISFQQTMNFTTMFLLLGMGLALEKK